MAGEAAAGEESEVVTTDGGGAMNGRPSRAAGQDAAVPTTPAQEIRLRQSCTGNLRNTLRLRLSSLARPRLAGHAGTVVGILAPGPSAKPFTASSESTDAMAVDDTPSTSTSASTSTSKEKEKSEAAKKKEEEARVEREKKYPPPHRAGIVLAAEKKVTSKLLEKDKGSSEKLFLINGLRLDSFRRCSVWASCLTSRAFFAQERHLGRRGVQRRCQLARLVRAQRRTGARAAPSRLPSLEVSSC